MNINWSLYYGANATGSEIWALSRGCSMQYHGWLSKTGKKEAVLFQLKTRTYIFTYKDHYAWSGTQDNRPCNENSSREMLTWWWVQLITSLASSCNSGKTAKPLSAAFIYAIVKSISSPNSKGALSSCPSMMFTHLPVGFTSIRSSSMYIKTDIPNRPHWGYFDQFSSSSLFTFRHPDCL